MFHHLKNKIFLARSNNEVSSKVYFEKQLCFFMYIYLKLYIFTLEVPYLGNSL